MASTPSRNSARTRDKDKAARGVVGAGRDTPEPLLRSSRTPRRSNRLKPEPPPIVFHFHGDVQLTKSTICSRSPDEEEPERLRRSRPTLPATSNAYGETARRIQRSHRISTLESEEVEEESEDFESDRDYSCKDEPSQPQLVSRATPRAVQRVQASDSGYSGSTRGLKREKNEVYRAASLSRGSSDGSFAAEGSSHAKRKTKPPSGESKVEEGATSEGNESHLVTQGDNRGDNNDDSDDDFVRRLMKVPTHDDKKVDADVILDTGTKPDWISSDFLTEKLGRKYTRFKDEENKQEFSDFNGNKFNGIGKAGLMIYSSDFSGFPCRTISFLVAKGGNFQILLGSRTIRKEKLLYKPPGPQMEGAFPAVQTDPKKAERAVIVQNKENQNREGMERDKMREERRAANKNKSKESKSSSSSAARLARDSKPPPRREKSTSPSRRGNAKHPVSKNAKSKAPVYERSSSSSLSGNW